MSPLTVDMAGSLGAGLVVGQHDKKLPQRAPVRISLDFEPLLSKPA